MANVIPHSGSGAATPRGAANNLPAHLSNDGGEDKLDIREIIAVFRRNKLLVANFVALLTIAAAYFAFSQPAQYRAAAVIRLKNERQVLSGGLESEALNQVVGKTVDPFLSQLQVLRSRTVARQIVDRTGMRLRPLEDSFSLAAVEDVVISRGISDDTIEFRFEQKEYVLRKDDAESRAAYGSRASLRDVSLVVTEHPGTQRAVVEIMRDGKAIDALLEKLSTRPLDKTDVVQVEFTHADPRVAQKVTNVAVDVFQEANASESQQQSRRRRLFLEEQLRKTDSVLASAQRELSAFRRREGVYSSREKFAAQQTGLLELEVRREELQADRRVFATLLQTLETTSNDARQLRTFVSAPGLEANPVVAQLYTQLLRYQSSRDSVTAGPWGNAERNPDVQRLDTLIANTERRLVDAVRSHVAAIDARLASLNEMLARNSAAMQALPEKEAEEMRLMLQVETATKLADQLREEYQKARIAEAIDVGQVEIIDRAALPLEPISSGRGLKITLGFILGLMLGGGAAFLRESLNTKVRRRDEIESLLHLPGLAVIPRISTNGRAERPKLRLALRSKEEHVIERPLERLVTISEGRSTGAEAYRSLRTNLLFAQSANELRRIVVTSAMAAEGKTTTSANLAVTFAQQGKRVIIVDGDLRKASLHKVFGVTREPGLADVIANFANLEDSIRPTTVPHLSVLSAGTLPPNPSELLGGSRMREILDQLTAEFELVIIDAPPVLVVGDASILSALADGTVMVVRAGQTDTHAAVAAVRQLKSVGARMLGAVLNDPDAKVANYEGYYYYAYEYYGEEEPAN